MDLLTCAEGLPNAAAGAHILVGRASSKTFHSFVPREFPDKHHLVDVRRVVEILCSVYSDPRSHAVEQGLQSVNRLCESSRNGENSFLYAL